MLALASSVFLLATVGAWSPTNSYAPGNVTCDDDINLVREAVGLSTDESEWLKKREAYTNSALEDFLNRATENFTDNSIVKTLFSSSSAPRIGVACSGGGYRAMLSGAGMLAAMDNRTRGSVEHGLGGLLQSTTYLAGLSGGNWLVGTLAWNNWTSVQDILDTMGQDDDIWDISNSIISPGGTNVLETTSRWDDISDAVDAKQDAGFNASLTDVWGRALSYAFFPTLPNGGDAYTWSTLREADVFKNAEMPFPISVADGRYPGTQVINLNATVFEFNPFEMGSWDRSLRAFTDVKYLGTKVNNGTPEAKGQCIAGFDNTGFIMGTSSSLFNQFLLRLNTTGLPSFIYKLANKFLTGLSDDYDDIALYAPNPFKGTDHVVENYTRSIVESEILYLVDGGEDGQNIPLIPLLQEERELDVIFALDNSADTDDYWPNGLSLTQTYERQFEKQGDDIAFPYVPDVSTFAELGLNKRPTFFGCDATNLTDLDYIPPLVVYMPNTKESFNSNQSTFKLSYSSENRRAMIKNGFEAVTRNNLTDDSDFVSCVACAVIRRKQQSMNATLPEECEKCFTNYCWNGTVSKGSASISSYNDYTVTSVSGSSATGTTTSGSSASSSNSDTRNSGGVLVTPCLANIYILLAAVIGVVAGLM